MAGLPRAFALLVVALVAEALCIALACVHPDRFLHTALWPTPFVAVAAFAATAFLAWRVWAVARYRPVASVDDASLPSITVVVPAYNEGRQVLLTLRSLALSDYPHEKLQLVAVDDGSVDDTWTHICTAADELGARLTTVRCPKNGGKRAALAAGFARARGSILVTIDSDCEVLPETLRNLVSPFVVDARVGAVAGNVRVLNPAASLIGRMLDVSFTFAFELVRASESQAGAVFCCPGAGSAWRADLVWPVLDGWTRQKFLGRLANIGEDRSLTNLILRAGAHVVFQQNAVVLTTVPSTFAGLRRMLVRWERGNIRETLELGGFVFTRFRAGPRGAVRALFVWSTVQMSLQALSFVPMVLFLGSHPAFVPLLLAGAAAGALFPAATYASLRSTPVRALWAFPWALFSTVALSWVGLFSLLTVHRSGWLTRERALTPSHATPQSPLSTRLPAFATLVAGESLARAPRE